jgi:hypothetical protein
MKAAIEDFIPPSYPGEIESESGGGDGIRQPPPAAGEVPRDRPRRNQPPGSGTGEVRELGLAGV